MLETLHAVPGASSLHPLCSATVLRFAFRVHVAQFALADHTLSPKVARLRPNELRQCVRKCSSGSYLGSASKSLHMPTLVEEWSSVCHRYYPCAGFDINSQPAAEMASWRRLTHIHHAAADAVFAAEVIGIPFPIFGGRFLFSLAKAGATCSAGHGEGPAPLGVGDEGGALDVAML